MERRSEYAEAVEEMIEEIRALRAASKKADRPAKRRKTAPGEVGAFEKAREAG